jgi:hypothetical protein
MVKRSAVLRMNVCVCLKARPSQICKPVLRHFIETPNIMKMISRNLLIIMAGLFSFLISCKEQNSQTVQSLTNEKYKIGQVWKYDNRIGEDSSTLTILKIEKYEKGDTIIHIRVDGIKIYNSQAPSGYSNFIGHLPFSEKSISKSVTVLVGQNNNLPDFSDGYNEWKEAWDSGKGGYWTVDLKEAINGVDKAMQPKK